MKISQKQITNPGIIDASDKRKRQFSRYKEAVRRAKFLNDKEKKHWTLLGYLLDVNQLLEAERLIISEDLKLLKVKQELERIKPNVNKNA